MSVGRIADLARADRVVLAGFCGFCLCVALGGVASGKLLRPVPIKCIVFIAFSDLILSVSMLPIGNPSVVEVIRRSKPMGMNVRIRDV
jgi:hypothetical protein